MSLLIKLAFLAEMATSTSNQHSKIYYHGTSSIEKAKSIYKNGLDPAATEIKYPAKHVQKPLEGRVYITPSLGYAMIYALGGSYFGHSYPESMEIKDHLAKEELGFVFEIDGKDLNDIIPDEDSIGEAVYKFQVAKENIKKESYQAYAELYSLALKHLTELQLKKNKEGNYNDWIRVGKKLTKVMPPELALKLIDTGDFHIAHAGKLKISKCYSFEKKKCKEIKPDGSNFFDFAKLWQP